MSKSKIRETFAETIKKVSQTPGFSVAKVRDGSEDMIVSSDIKGGSYWKYTPGSESTKIERTWKRQLARIGWSMQLWEQRHLVNVRADDIENTQPVVIDLDQQYRDADAAIKANAITVEVESIGPIEAEHMLIEHEKAATARGIEAGITSNPLPLDADEALIQQRRIDEKRVNTYVKLMIDGEWHPLLPQGISLTVDNWLGDGQHRVEAIIKSGTVQSFYVFRGVPDSAFPCMDLGKPRSERDFLHMQGKYEDPNMMAAARIVWIYDNLPNLTHWNTRHRMPDRIVITRYLMSHYPTLDEHVRAVSTFSGGRKPLTKSAAAAFRYVMTRHDPSMADRIDEYLDDIRMAVGARERSVTYLLYEFGLNRKERETHGFNPSTYLFLLLLWGWEHFIAGTPILRIGWRPSNGVPKL